MTSRLRSVFVLLLVVALAQAAPAVAAGKQVLEREVAPGVTYRRVINPKIPRVTHTITVDPASGYTLDVGLAKPKLPGMATTSSMASEAGALAAINGDFGILPGRPAHLFADDGELLQPSQVGGNGRGFGFGPDGTPMHIGVTNVRMSVAASGARVRVERWNNGPPGANGLVVFSPRGGTWETPPEDACAARLISASGWSVAGTGMERSFTVDAVRCGQAPMNPDGGFVLASRQSGTGSAYIQALAPGSPVSLKWTVGWTGTQDVLGGSAVLVENGDMAAEAGCSGYLCMKHPRTGVGITADGKVLMIQVEGRYWRSNGATLSQFARIFINAGASYAMNLDGGGSSTMVIEGKVVNYLSDGIQRSVSSALLVVPDPAA